jgi:hypothetical protein
VIQVQPGARFCGFWRIFQKKLDDEVLHCTLSEVALDTKTYFVAQMLALRRLLKSLGIDVRSPSLFSRILRPRHGFSPIPCG